MARRIAMGAAAMLVVAGNPAWADNEAADVPAAVNQREPGGLDEIVVTAQRRSEPLQSVPIAVSAVTGLQAEARGLNDIVSLSSAIPSLTVNVSGNSATVFLRGVGSNAGNPNDEPSVATYVDGIYYPNPNATIFDFNNVERIEVLKGPQGTLFGRNATGGVIQIVTREPTQEPTLEATVGYGSFNTVKSSVYASGGLAKGAALSVAAVYSDQGRGFGHDLETGAEIGKYDSKGVRAKLLLDPFDKTEIHIAADYEQNFNTRPFQLVQGVAGVDGMVVNPGDFNTRANWQNYDQVKQGGGSIRIDQDFDVLRLASISGYRRLTGALSFDEDCTPVPLVNTLLDQAAHDFTQELQLLSPTGSRVNWLLGWFHYNGFASYDPFFLSGLAAAPLPSLAIIGDQRTRSDSAYGQATAEVFADTNLTLGLRYTSEASNRYTLTSSTGVPLGPSTLDTTSFDKLTWRASLDHKFNSDLMVYVSDNRGIKSGGFNLVSPGAPPFKPEVLDAYEIGVKSELFGERARLNAAAFYYKYKDIQVQSLGAAGLISTNAASATVKGVDFDLEVKLTSDLRLTGGASYLDGHYDHYPNAVVYPASALDGGAQTIDASGRNLIQAPHFTGNLGLTQTISSALGTVTFNANVTYNSGSFVSAANRLAYPAYALVNASADWTERGGRYGFRLWGKNLTNRTYYDQRSETGVGDLQVQAPPRTYGIEGHVKF